MKAVVVVVVEVDRNECGAVETGMNARKSPREDLTFIRTSLCAYCTS